MLKVSVILFVALTITSAQPNVTTDIESFSVTNLQSVTPKTLPPSSTKLPEKDEKSDIKLSSTSKPVDKSESIVSPPINKDELVAPDPDPLPDPLKDTDKLDVKKPTPPPPSPKPTVTLEKSVPAIDGNVTTNSLLGDDQPLITNLHSHPPSADGTVFTEKDTPIQDWPKNMTDAITSTSPTSVSEVDQKPDPALKLRLLLYTRKHPNIGVPLTSGNLSTMTSLVYYKPDQPTRFIIHSSFDGPESSTWMKEMKNRLLNIEDSNVVLVDWSSGASSTMADQRLSAVRMVGIEISRVIRDLKDAHGTKARSVHLIAHGFGTFAADVVGRQVSGLGRISALDPGGPNFDALTIDGRLDKSDAEFVDVIHTDGHNTSTVASSLYHRGSQLPLGDVDFYPNGGSYQPGCSLQGFEDLVTRPIGEGVRRFVACHHYRAVDYYLESILPSSNQCIQIAYQCSNYTDFLEGKCFKCNWNKLGHACVQMGFRADHELEYLKKDDPPRKLYLSTNRRTPYCGKSSCLVSYSDYTLVVSTNSVSLRN